MNSGWHTSAHTQKTYITTTTVRGFDTVMHTHIRAYTYTDYHTHINAHIRTYIHTHE